MARVLVIEDETTLRLSVARGLTRLPGVAVDAAATMAEALAIVDRTPPDVVLSDIDLPDRSGLEVLGELGRRGLRRPVVFVSAYLRAYGAQIPPHADVEVLEKPASLEALREAVTRRLRATPAGQEPVPFAAADFLQLACMGRRSVQIEVHVPGHAPGRLVVCDGVAWSARDELGQGEDAFRRLAFRRDGPVECRALAAAPGPRNLGKSWESLVLEAAQAIDEAARDMVSPETIPTAASTPAPEVPDSDDFDAWWDRGVQALLGRRHGDALRAFARAQQLRPADRRVAANLARLHALGYRLDTPADEGPADHGQTHDDEPATSEPVAVTLDASLEEP